MPRKLIAEYLAQEEAVGVPTHVGLTAGDFAEEEPHIKCPCCGLMARIEPDTKRRKENRNRIPSLKEGPYHPTFLMQKYGGSVEALTLGQKEKRRGNMVWEDRRELNEEEQELLLRNLRGALEELEKIVVAKAKPTTRKRRM
jgi:hypothetical protein